MLISITPDEIYSVSSIWIQSRVCLYFDNLYIYKVVFCLVFVFSIKTHLPTKKYKRENVKKICLIGPIVIESYSFLWDKERTVKSACDDKLSH